MNNLRSLPNHAGYTSYYSKQTIRPNQASIAEKIQAIPRNTQAAVQALFSTTYANLRNIHRADVICGIAAFTISACITTYLLSSTSPKINPPVQLKLPITQVNPLLINTCDPQEFLPNTVNKIMLNNKQLFKVIPSANSPDFLNNTSSRIDSKPLTADFKRMNEYYIDEDDQALIVLKPNASIENLSIKEILGNRNKPVFGVTSFTNTSNFLNTASSTSESNPVELTFTSNQPSSLSWFTSTVSTMLRNLIQFTTTKMTTSQLSTTPQITNSHKMLADNETTILPKVRFFQQNSANHESQTIMQGFCFGLPDTQSSKMSLVTSSDAQSPVDPLTCYVRIASSESNLLSQSAQKLISLSNSNDVVSLPNAKYFELNHQISLPTILKEINDPILQQLISSMIDKTQDPSVQSIQPSNVALTNNQRQLKVTNLTMR